MFTMFVVPKHCEGGKTATMKYRGFFVANFYHFRDNRNKRGSYTVTGSQSRWPSQALGRTVTSSAFSISAYQRGKFIYVHRIKPQNEMRNNTTKEAQNEASASACAELQQAIQKYFGYLTDDVDEIEEDFFQMFQSAVYAMNGLGYDREILIHYSFLYRHTVRLLRELQKFNPQTLES